MLNGKLNTVSQPETWKTLMYVSKSPNFNWRDCITIGELFRQIYGLPLPPLGGEHITYPLSVVESKVDKCWEMASLAFLMPVWRGAALVPALVSTCPPSHCNPDPEGGAAKCRVAPQQFRTSANVTLKPWSRYLIRAGGWRLETLHYTTNLTSA